MENLTSSTAMCHLNEPTWSSSFMPDWMPETTIIHALDSERLCRIESNSWTEDVFRSLDPRPVFITILLLILLDPVINRFFLMIPDPIKRKTRSMKAQVLKKRPKCVDYRPSMWTVMVTTPIVEEIVYRFILHTIIKHFQSDSSCQTLATRILIGNTFFAFSHFNSANLRQQTIIDVIMQVVGILLFPTQSIIYETTKFPLASIISHIANNTYMTIISLAVKRMIFQKN